MSFKRIIISFKTGVKTESIKINATAGNENYPIQII